MEFIHSCDAVTHAFQKVRALLPAADIDAKQTTVSYLPALCNDVFLLLGSSKRFVARVAKDSDPAARSRANAYANQKAAAKCNLAPTPIVVSRDHSTAISTYAGTPLSRAHLSAERLTQVISLLQKLHNQAPRFRGNIELEQQLLLATRSPVLHNTPYVGWGNALRQQCLQMNLQKSEYVPCHGDPNLGNFVTDNDGQLRLIDWDHSGMSHAEWDLAAFFCEATLTPQEQQDAVSQYARNPTEKNRILERLPFFKACYHLLCAQWYMAQTATTDWQEKLYKNAIQTHEQGLLEYFSTPLKASCQ